ncbi:baseplate J/gp47 family protein [uncultured Thiodictyon sp.]|uniref:baseplate J/gp47 family protein n=1 Tax=uncultured Thiodictyon sp. TaxID=1846217 RepID=UPI0025E07198|nr:baseplate J/gp47 family protein [uncultured Thiodictyon sp.]
MSETAPPCPCQTALGPQTPVNPAGLAHLSYRVGDFLSFRRALLTPLDGERALASWRPNSQGDLLLQTLEWWAYIADVLTFYTEHSRNETLLGTAQLEESVQRLVRILGYRPRPGLGATAAVAALLKGAQTVLPAGFALDSKPPPGQASQTFETDTTLTLMQPDAVDAAPPRRLIGSYDQLYLQGSITDLAIDEHLILLPAGATPTAGTLLTVDATRLGRDPTGRAYTAITVVSPSGADLSALTMQDPRDYRLLRSRRSLGLWKYPTTVNLVSDALALEGLERATQAGDPMVLKAPLDTGLAPRLLVATGNSEVFWYTIVTASPLLDKPALPIPIPHSQLSYLPAIAAADAWDAIRERVRVLLDWRPAGVLRDAPSECWDGTPTTLVAADGQAFRVGNEQTVLIEDATGQGVKARVYVSADQPTRLEVLSFASPPPPLTLPLRVLHNVVPLTRGKGVHAEALGSGNALAIFQEFVLAKSPLTYLPVGDGYRSTLKIYVDGLAWTEVPSFYAQPPDARVFVTREDAQARTHVLFGDGVNGARLPTGHDNLSADYRYGSGAAAPAAGTLTVVARPPPGLARLRQPTAAGGGADPDTPDRIRRYAPRSVLTFGRAIAGDDYEAIAAQAPGVARVKAVYDWNAAENRATVSLYVGDTAAAVQSARRALGAAGDPNRPVSVVAATPVAATLSLMLWVAAGRRPEQVAALVSTALTDPDQGPFGARRVRIGEGLYFSRIAQCCLGVAGVVAVTDLCTTLNRPDPATGLSLLTPQDAPRIGVAAGEFLLVPEGGIAIAAEVQDHA